MFKMLSLICLIFFCLNVVVHMEIPLIEPVRDHVPMAEVALLVTERYISPKTNTAILMEECAYCKKTQQDFQLRLMNHFLKLTNAKANMALQLLYAEKNEKPWDCNIFVIDSKKAFLNLRSNFPETSYEREFYFFIMLTLKGTTTYMNYIMIRIFESCREFDVHNAVIMIEYTNGNFGFFTYQLFGTHFCQRVVVIQEVNRFHNGSLDNDFLFPERMRDFYNCPLIVSAHILHPMLIFLGDRNNETQRNDLTLWTGIDGDVLKLLAEALNFRINITIPEGRSVIGSERNSTACFAALESDNADIAIGGFSSSAPNHQVFSASLTYHQTPFIFVVRSSLHCGPLKQLVNPFNVQVWGLISLTLLIAISFIKLIEVYANTTRRNFILGPRNHTPIGNLLTILLGNPISKLPRRNFARFILMAWMLATLVIRNAYQGKMFDSLRVNRRLPIPRSIAELINEKYKLISSEYMNYYPQEMTVIMDNMTERFMSTENGMRFTTVAIMDTLAVYNHHHWNTSRLTYVDEHIYLFQLAMYFRKNSILKTAFDRKLKMLIDAGITGYIAAKHMKKPFLFLNVGSQKLPIISNGMLWGLYVIYLTLNGIAVVTFVIELLSKKSQLMARYLDCIQCNKK